MRRGVAIGTVLDDRSPRAGELQMHTWRQRITPDDLCQEGHLLATCTIPSQAVS